MPKVLVLFDETDAVASSLGESAAAGARGVRFTEVDVRIFAAVAGSQRKALESPTAIDQYDGVVFAALNDSPTPALENVLAGLAQTPGPRLANVVFGAIQPDHADHGNLPAQLLSLGGIAVGQTSAGDDNARARALGARVAQVAGWVRHSLAHEESDAHPAHHQGHHHAH
jgi:hypothetical protein